MKKNSKNNIKQSKNKRPSLLEENYALKETIKALQDQNTNLTESNHDLDKQNSILEERLSNFGLRDFCKNAGWAGMGIAAGVGFTGYSSEGLKVALLSGVLIMVFSIYDNVWVKSREKKKKVGE